MKTYPTLSAIPHKDECDYWPVCGACDSKEVCIRVEADITWSKGAAGWQLLEFEVPNKSEKIVGFCMDCRTETYLVWTSNWEGEE